MDGLQLRVLDLQSNRIRSSSGLASLTSLEELLQCWIRVTCRYLAYNGIPEITGLEALDRLNTLDLTYNFLTTTNGFDGFKSLEYLWVEAGMHFHASCHRPGSISTTPSRCWPHCHRHMGSGIEPMG